MYFLEDRAEAAFIDPLILASLPIAVAAIVFALRMRGRLLAHPRRAADYHVLRLDISTAIVAWGMAQVGASLGWLLRLDGLRMPVWSYLGLVIGAVIAVVGWRKDQRGPWSADARTEGTYEEPDGGWRHVRSATWEFGLLALAGSGLLTYLLTAGHHFAHPIHWAISVLGATAGFGLGLVLRSPRVDVHIHGPSTSRAVRPDMPERGTRSRLKAERRQEVRR